MYTEDALIAGIKQRSDKVINYLYNNNLRKVQATLSRYSAKEEDCQSIFHDALLTSIENVVNGKFRGDSKIETYIVSVAKFKWFNELKNRKANILEYQDEIKALEIEVSLDEEEDDSIYEAVRKHMDNIDEKCRQILTGFYFDKRRLGDLAEEYGYTNAFIRVKKGRCLNKLKSLLENQI